MIRFVLQDDVSPPRFGSLPGTQYEQSLANRSKYPLWSNAKLEMERNFVNSQLLLVVFIMFPQYLGWIIINP